MSQHSSGSGAGIGQSWRKRILLGEDEVFVLVRCEFTTEVCGTMTETLS